jgi:hypothetical protein
MLNVQVPPIPAGLGILPWLAIMRIVLSPLPRMATASWIVQRSRAGRGMVLRVRFVMGKAAHLICCRGLSGLKRKSVANPQVFRT